LRLPRVARISANGPFAVLADMLELELEELDDPLAAKLLAVSFEGGSGSLVDPGVFLATPLLERVLLSGCVINPDALRPVAPEFAPGFTANAEREFLYGSVTKPDVDLVSGSVTKPDLDLLSGSVTKPPENALLREDRDPALAGDGR